MTTSSLTAQLPRTRSMIRIGVNARHLAGSAFFAAGAIVFMGIVTAEAFYPLTYTTFGNEISDLGGTRPPAGLVFQPSATIFNGAMLLAGLLTATGSLFAHRAFGRWLVTLPLAIFGTAITLVAIFPGNTGTPHAVSAMVAFFAGGIAAVLSSSVTRPPFRYLLVLLGLVNLTLLASYFTLGDSNPLWALGVGGAERWVAFPEILFMLGFGGYLAGSGESEERARSQPGRASTGTAQPGT